MNPILQIVSDAHAEYDRLWAVAKQQNNIQTTCSRGCSHCCSEACYVLDVEVDQILEHLPKSELNGVIERTKTWNERAEASGLLAFQQGPALPWREANIPCPLLKNGECLIYEHRPMSCRAFATDQDPQGCADLKQRDHQRYVSCFTAELKCAQMLVSHYNDQDHLGAYLTRRLLGIKIKTASFLKNPFLEP